MSFFNSYPSGISCVPEVIPNIFQVNTGRPVLYPFPSVASINFEPSGRTPVSFMILNVKK